MKILSVIIPCYNEINTIEKVIDLINKVNINKQIILVDDCSNDGTKELIKNKLLNKVDVAIFLEQNQGKCACIKEGIKHVKGDAVIIQNANFQYDPNDYIKLVKPIFDNETNVTYGSRYLNKKRKELKFNIIGNKFLNWLSNKLNKQQLSDVNTCYICFNSNLINKLNFKDNSFSFNVEITAQFAKLNEKIVDIPITYNPKKEKKRNFKDSFKHILCIFKCRKEKISLKNKILNILYWVSILGIILVPIILINDNVGMYFDSVFPDYAATQIINPQKYQVGYTWFFNYPYLVQLYHGSFSMFISMIEIAIFKNTSLLFYRINNGIYIFIILILINNILKLCNIDDKIRKISIFAFSFMPCLFTICLTQYYIELPGIIFYLLGTILILKSVKNQNYNFIKLFFGYILIGFSIYCYFNFVFLSILPIVWFATKYKTKLFNYFIVSILGLLTGCSLYITSFYNNFSAMFLVFIVPISISLLISIISYFVVKNISICNKFISTSTICLIIMFFLTTMFLNKTKIINFLNYYDIGANKITFFERFKYTAVFFSNALTSCGTQNLFLGGSVSTFKYLPLIVFLFCNIMFFIFYFMYAKKNKIFICQKTMYVFLLILSNLFLSLFIIQRMQTQHFIPLIFASFVEIVFIISFMIKNIKFNKKTLNITKLCYSSFSLLLITFSIINQYEIIHTTKLTGCTNKYTIQINNLCYEANEKHKKGINEIYVFPEWGFFAPFDYLTNNKIPFSTNFEENTLSIYLENFSVVNIVFWNTSYQKYANLFDNIPNCKHELYKYCNYNEDVQFYKLEGKKNTKGFY